MPVTRASGKEGAPQRSSPEPRIVVSRNGPYIVSGRLPLQVQIITPNADGMSWTWTPGKQFDTPEPYELCRCGHSSNKPFCDGTHKRVKFQGAETASRAPYADLAEVTEGPTLVLGDAEELCAFARFCDPGGKIWGLVPRSNDPESRQLAIREGKACPSGRLVVRDRPSSKVLEPVLPPSIGVIEDPALGCSGALWVRGGVRVESSDGSPYPVRNRMTLCRCGESGNKPFCNGSHASTKFRDGLMEFPDPV